MVQKPESSIEMAWLSKLKFFVSELPNAYMGKYLPKVDLKSPEPKNINDVLYFLENLPDSRKTEFVNIMLSEIQKPGFARNFNEMIKALEILPNNILRKEYLNDIDAAVINSEIKLNEKQLAQLAQLRMQFTEPTLKLITEIKTKTKAFILDVREQIINEISHSKPLKKLIADALGIEVRALTKKQMRNSSEDLDRFILSYVPSEQTDKIKEPMMQLKYGKELMDAMQESTPKKCINAAKKIFENTNARTVLQNSKRGSFWGKIFEKLGFNKGKSYTRFFDEKVKTIETQIKTPHSRPGHGNR